MNLLRLIALALLMLLPASAAAQPIIDRVQRVTGGERLDLDDGKDFFAPAPAQAGITVGAWTAPAYLHFGDTDFNSRANDAVNSIAILDQRAWARWDTKGGQTVFIRGRYLNLQYDLSPGATYPVVYEEGMALDLGYVDLPEGDFSFRLGRQFLALGRSVTLSQNLDGVRAGYSHGPWDLSAFAATTPDQITDIDPAVGRSDRDFLGFTAAYHTTDGHSLFGYYLDQEDGTSLVAAGQGLAYDSRYHALGAEGPVFDLDHLSYYVEAIREDGESINRGTAANRAPVEADAFLGELAFRPDVEGHPTYWVSFSRGSGDPDRGSAVTSAGGNRVGTPDTAFIGFGRFDGGLGLSPRLTNIAITRAGASWKLREAPRDEDLLILAAAASIYRKSDPAGPISHPAAVNLSDDVGHGFDASITYKPWHDLVMTLQAGRFSPGDAFAAGNRDDGTVVYAGLTYSY